jgi:hypothetical protein
MLADDVDEMIVTMGCALCELSLSMASSQDDDVKYDGHARGLDEQVGASANTKVSPSCTICVECEECYVEMYSKI